MAKVMGYIGDGGRDLGVTNLNKIDIPGVHERFVIKDIIFVPPKVSYAKKVIGISTYADTLKVCYHKIRNKIWIQGAVIKIIAEENDFYQIVFEGQDDNESLTGYVKKEYVNPS